MSSGDAKKESSSIREYNVKSTHDFNFKCHESQCMLKKKKLVQCDTLSTNNFGPV